MSEENIMKRIPVVFTPDEYYFYPTIVAIYSMLNAKKDTTCYYFYIIVSDKIEDDKLSIFKEFKLKNDSFQYEIKKINIEFLRNKHIPIKHLTSSAYIRLFLSDILEEDKVMYHDGDILVLDDLSEMYDINIESNYVAGVKAALNNKFNKSLIYFLNSNGFTDFSQYIFSGDLTINLKKIKHDNITSKFIDLIINRDDFMDQEILNYCCEHYISFLPLKYCVLNRWINKHVLQNSDQKSFASAELEEGIDNCAIIHFAGSEVKPWVNLRAVGSELWWNYAVQLLKKDDYLKWYNNADIHTRKRDYEYLFTELNKNDKIYIFGFGVFGKTLCELLLRNGYNVLGFIDNDKKKNGSKIYGVEVYSLNQVNSENVIFINTVINYEKEIKEQLLCNGVLEKNIVRFINKTAIYYQALDEKYYEYELNDILKYEYPDENYINATNLFMNDKTKKEKYFTQYWIESKYFKKEE